jgi:hypothetical protein
MTGEEMKKAYRVARELLWDRLDTTMPGTTEILRQVHQSDLVVVQGQYDHIEDVLESADMPFSLIEPGRLDRARLRPDQIVFVNCPGIVTDKALRKLREFVEQGGFLFTTDWAIKHVLERAFPGYIEFNKNPTQDEVVRIEILDRDDSFLKSVLDAGDDPLWWLESSSYPIRILDAEKVKVLIRSKEIQERHGEDPVFVSFEVGKGVVYHMISHFYLQRTETRTARQAKASTDYVLAKGIDMAALAKYKELGAQEITTGQLESALTSSTMITSIVYVKRARERGDERE